MTHLSSHQDSAGREPLRLGAVFRHALATYRTHFVRVTGIALVVFLLPALGYTALDQWAEHNQHDAARMIVLLVITLVIGVGLSELGTTFYSGFLDQLVGEEQFGHARRSIGEVLQTLPYLRLIGASFLVLLLTILASVLLIIPGLLVYTLLCLSGPLINIEGLGVFAALRRSAQLVRPRFWFVVRAVTLPVIAETALDTGIEYVLHGSPWLEALIVDGLLAITILAIVAFIEVTLAHELVARDRATAAGAG